MGARDGSDFESQREQQQRRITPQREEGHGGGELAPMGFQGRGESKTQLSSAQHVGESRERERVRRACEWWCFITSRERKGS